MVNKLQDDDPEKKGFRAAEAYVRPTPTSTHGNVIEHGFDLRNCTFTLSLEATSSTPEDAPTEIFLPEFHFPTGRTEVQVTGGKWTISVDESDIVPVQKLSWWHSESEQKITVKGVIRKAGEAGAVEAEEGYFEQYARACVVM